MTEEGALQGEGQAERVVRARQVRGEQPPPGPTLQRPPGPGFRTTPGAGVPGGGRQAPTPGRGLRGFPFFSAGGAPPCLARDGGRGAAGCSAAGGRPGGAGGGGRAGRAAAAGRSAPGPRGGAAAGAGGPLAAGLTDPGAPTPPARPRTFAMMRPRQVLRPSPGSLGVPACTSRNVDRGRPSAAAAGAAAACSGPAGGPLPPPGGSWEPQAPRRARAASPCPPRRRTRPVSERGRREGGHRPCHPPGRTPSRRQPRRA